MEKEDTLLNREVVIVILLLWWWRSGRREWELLCGTLVKNEKKKRGDGFASEGRTTRERLGVALVRMVCPQRINLLGLGVLVWDEEGVFFCILLTLLI
jgi:hypothetical protein